MIKMIVILTLAIVSMQETVGQELMRTIYGTVIDAQTSKPIPYIYVEASTQSTVTDYSGLFSIAATGRVILYISHIGYHQISINAISALNDTINISLIPKERVLKEVIITEFKELDILKKEVLGLDIRPTRNKINADRNLLNSKALYMTGYRPAMTSYDNYRSFIKGPQPVTFFSSDPTKGFSGVIRSIKRSKSPVLFSPQKVNLKIESDWSKLFLIKPDTLKH